MTDLYDETGRVRHEAIVKLMEDVVNSALDSRLGGIADSLERIDAVHVQRLDEISQALTGNGLGVSKGLIGLVKQMEECDQQLVRRIAALENRWERMKWTLVGAAAGAGATAGGVAGVLVKVLGG